VTICVSADRLSEKLASATREKVTSISHHRHLQEQRKQRAAAFLTRMKQSDVDQTVEDAATAAADSPSNPGTVQVFDNDGHKQLP